jgi:hypothetical protein
MPPLETDPQLRTEDSLHTIFASPKHSKGKTKTSLLQAVEGSGAPVYYMKGALEGVLVKCDSYLQHGSVRPLANTAVPATVVRHAAELGKRRGCCNVADIPTCKLTVSRDFEGVKCGI